MYLLILASPIWRISSPSLDVRKTSAWSKYKYIVKELNNFDEPIHADILILHVDILIFLTDNEVEKILSSNVKILIDGAFEAFVYPYYYPILKLFVDLDIHNKNYILL